MHPFPPSEELSFLLGAKLTQIRLNPYNLDFAFDQGSCITSEHVIEFVAPDGRSSRHDVQKGLGSAPVTFHQCIDRKVVDIDSSELRLSLRLEDGSTLHFETEIGPYESGQIGHKSIGDDDHQYIVF